MKKFITFVFLIALAMGIQVLAEDVLVFRNGDILNCIVIEITKTEIKYKKMSNPNGPIHSVDKSNILSIKFENGEIEKFNTSASSDINRVPNIGDVEKDEDNYDKILLFNRGYQPTEKLNSSKKNNRTFYSWAITDSSILSSKEISVNFDGNIDYSDIGNYQDGGIYKNWQYGDTPTEDNGTYQIQITNKINTPIYIDLGNTFRIDNGTPNFYYDGSEIKSIGHGNSMGVSLGLGAVGNVLGIGAAGGALLNGVGVSGSTNNGNNTTYLKERVLIVPPLSTLVLSKPKWVKVGLGGKYFGSGHFENVGGHFEICPIFNKSTILLPKKQSEIIKFGLSDTPYRRTYYLTYSTDSNFTNYKVLTIELYINMLMGTNGNKNGVSEFDEHTISGFCEFE